MSEPTISRNGKRMGRPPKFTAAQIEAVAESIALGLPIHLACARHGVSLSSWQRNSTKNKKAVDRIISEFYDRALADIRTGQKGWQGAAWIMERCHGFKVNSQVTVQTVVAGLQLEQVVAVRRAAVDRVEKQRQITLYPKEQGKKGYIAESVPTSSVPPNETPELESQAIDAVRVG